MPEHYENVGKALAIAALDIIEMNPHTRVPNTSFGSLEAIRNWIKFYIKSKPGGGFVAPAISKQDRSNSLANGDTLSSKKSVQKNQFYLQQRMNKLSQSNNSKSFDPKNQASKNKSAR